MHGAKQELEGVVEYNRALLSLANDPEVLPGVSRATVHGGKYEEEGRRRETRQLFRCSWNPSPRPCQSGFVHLLRSESEVFLLHAVGSYISYFLHFHAGMVEGRARQDHEPSLTQRHVACCRVFLEEKIKQEGGVSAELASQLTELQLALGLGPKEADTVKNEVISEAYKCDLHPVIFLKVQFNNRTDSIAACFHAHSLLTATVRQS